MTHADKYQGTTDMTRKRKGERGPDGVTIYVMDITPHDAKVRQTQGYLESRDADLIERPSCIVESAVGIDVDGRSFIEW